jgi:hypothetical protein
MNSSLWITPAQAGQILSMHPDTVARKVNAGELAITVSKSAGGHRRYARDDVESAAQGTCVDAQLERHMDYISGHVSDMELIVPRSDLRQIFSTERKLLGELDQWGDDSGTDENVRRVISLLLTGRRMPMHGEGERAYRAWRQRLEREALGRGWQIVGEAEDQNADWSEAEPAAAHAVLVYGSLPPAQVKMKMHFRHPDLIARQSVLSAPHSRADRSRGIRRLLGFLRPW